MKTPEFKKTGLDYINNGKINWRDWVPYPDNLPADIISLIDHVAVFTELAGEIKGDDKLEKFDHLTWLAFNKGLINKEEYLRIGRVKHRAATLEIN